MVVVMTIKLLKWVPIMAGITNQLKCKHWPLKITQRHYRPRPSRRKQSPASDEIENWKHVEECIVKDRPFQVGGPTTENNGFALLQRERANGTTKSLWTEERSVICTAASEKGKRVIQPFNLWPAKPQKMARNLLKNILKNTWEIDNSYYDIIENNFYSKLFYLDTNK